MAAGVLSVWTVALCAFPVDAAKSRLQLRQGPMRGNIQGSTGRTATGSIAGAPGVTARGKGLVGGLAELATEGGLYRGAGAQLARAVPVHAAYLPFYDALLAHARSLELGGGGEGGLLLLVGR